MTTAMIRPVLVALGLVALAGCSSDGRELADPVFPLPAPPPTVPESSVPATEPIVPAPPATEPATSPPVTEPRTIVFDRLHSPANATAEITGTGAVPSDPVTVDGAPGDLISFETEPSGAFTAQVWIEAEGAHTVCVADTCGRVFTLAPDAETPEEVIAEIEEAIGLAAELIPYETWFPEWTIEIGGALSGTGGTTDADRRVVTVYRNRGRTVDDFVRTILHEFGHVADAERLDDDARAEYLALAGYPVGTPWRDPEARRIDDWARQPSEDFAEVLVAAWTDSRWTPRTREVADDELLAATLELAGFDTGS